MPENSHTSNSNKLDKILNWQSTHEEHDDTRFAELYESTKHLATKDDVQKITDTLEPIAEAFNTIRNGRTGIIWVATTIAVVGSAVLVIKGFFKD